MSLDASPCTGPRLRSRAVGGLSGDIFVPGDKSMSHRALILGAMAGGETWIGGLLEAKDVLHTARAVQAFGAGVDRAAQGTWRVRGGDWKSPARPIDCGNSGTAARLLLGAAAGYRLETKVIGDRSLSTRPMERVLAPLRQMGANAEGEKLPVSVRGGGLRGISFTNSKASAQVKSAVLLAGLRAEGDVEVIEPAPSRDHTENMLRVFGCDIAQKDGTIRLGAKRELTGQSVEIPGDPSSAAFPLVAALLVPGSEVTVRSVLVNPLRTGLFTTLQEMGADLRIENPRTSGFEPVADLTARSSELQAVEVPASRAPSMIDEYPILAVASACARGRSVMHGLSELRVKESDRLGAVVAGLQACGVEAWQDGDALVVEGCGGAPPGGGVGIRAQDDHRIAMSFLVLGLAARKPVAVDSADMIGTSFPGFVEVMRSIGADIR
ncbi:MAG: 3-phosphoshikimate 1-carboxyvinyltransferase [uncultured Sphingomonadaceae bacterium]|uniref:3-phosphoshikimate 1-carboxyvinyltransferase n=1 Tax=uncultured Sphingomonadaceae bacterium TaxID=169976 RepID=A0A6J4U505_9SPHN|nr:MAG: 3-phosphoshikimate 1-carboxyvinyltransferase [uncultured Sphingomonadaceae bacterium]